MSNEKQIKYDLFIPGEEINLSDIVCIVAFDAGAAAQIANYIVNFPNKIFFSLGGPAIEIFESLFKDLENIPLEDAIRLSDIVICGTGWQSNFEWECIKLCKRLQKPVIACIDHWVNYRARFIRNGSNFLPDEIWVFDEYARELAEEKFPSISVVQKTNYYLIEQVKQIKKKEDQKLVDYESILYLLEPIRELWKQPFAGEFQALDIFINNLALISLDEKIEILLKPHPTDIEGKYDEWLMKHHNLNISITTASLSEAIAHSTVIVGCRTYAMVVALYAGRTVYSTIPADVKTARLPFENIIELDKIAPSST